MVVSRCHICLKGLFFLLVVFSFSNYTYFSLKATWVGGRLPGPETPWVDLKEWTSFCRLSMNKFSTGVHKCGGNCLFWNPTVLVFKFRMWRENGKNDLGLLCSQRHYVGRRNSSGWNFSWQGKVVFHGNGELLTEVKVWNSCWVCGWGALTESKER